MGAWDRVPVVRIEAGKHGMWGLANSARVPLGGLLMLRNATLEDSMWRVGPGRATITSSLFGAANADLSRVTAIDYFPNLGAQRAVIAQDAAGKIKVYPNPATGTGIATVATGLSRGIVPHFSVGGAESVGRARKVFYADGVNTPQVGSGDFTSMAAIATPNADWAGTNQPRFFFTHQGYNWAGGVPSAPHTLYRSLASDHEDFNTTPKRFICGPRDAQQYLVGGMPFRGGLLVFAYPEGVYFMDTTSSTITDEWFPYEVAVPGASGPRCFTAVEDAVVWVDPDLNWHTLQTTYQKTLHNQREISTRKLGRPTFLAQYINTAVLSVSDLVYDALAREVVLACSGVAGHGADNNELTLKNRRIHLDVSNRDGQGENWLFWDRDMNACVFPRRNAKGGTSLAYIDLYGLLASYFPAGAMLELGQAARRDPQGYQNTFEWMLRETDFSPIAAQWAGRKKNLKFLQLGYQVFATEGSDITHTVQVFCDGELRQTISFTLTGSGDTLPVTLPYTFAPNMAKYTARYPLSGQCDRLAVRGYTTHAGADFGITEVLVGAAVGA